MVEVGDGWDVGEYQYFTDDVKLIYDMLDGNWENTLPLEKPIIAYKPEQWMTHGDRAFIYIYQISRYNSVSTTDYRTLQRTSFLAVRTTARTREYLYAVVDNIYKIILAHRRVGQRDLGGFTFMEIINDRSLNDLTGWYTNTLDIKLTTYNYPIESSGFGMKKCCPRGAPPEDAEYIEADRC